jgi:hypothetical protein
MVNIVHTKYVRTSVGVELARPSSTPKKKEQCYVLSQIPMQADGDVCKPAFFVHNNIPHFIFHFTE